MVTGGFDGSRYRAFDSTEIFSDNSWRSVTAKLPARMYALRVAALNNRVLAFGN